MIRPALVVAIVLGVAPAAADPHLAFPDLAAPPHRSTVELASDATWVSDGEYAQGVSGSLRLRPSLENARGRFWIEFGRVAWRDQMRLIADHTMTGLSPTNLALGGEVWTRPRLVRGYARIAISLATVAALQEPDRPMLGPDDSTRDVLALSQQARITELSFDRPTTHYLKLATGARVDTAQVAVQLEAGIDVIAPIDYNDQYGPLLWGGLGVAAPVAKRVDIYGRAVARLSRTRDLDNRDAGVSVGAGAMIRLPRGRLTVGLDVRVDDCPLTYGWGAAGSSATCGRLLIGYRVPWR